MKHDEQAVARSCCSLGQSRFWKFGFSVPKEGFEVGADWCHPKGFGTSSHLFTFGADKCFAPFRIISHLP